MSTAITPPAAPLQANGLTVTSTGSSFVIRHPDQKNALHPIKTSNDAKTIFKITSDVGLNRIKDFLKKVDLTAISTRSLAAIGKTLNDNNLISDAVLAQFKAGSMEYDNKGKQINLDKPFNALALFDQKMDDRTEYANATPKEARTSTFRRETAGIQEANHVISAMSWFAHSGSGSLSVSIHA
ncbi:MAG: hypothetical protein ACOH2R_25930 [Pseudomonas sp.]